MQGLSGFQAIAAARGEGFLPELLALIGPRAAGNVIELARFGPSIAVVAGPSPIAPLDQGSNVVTFQTAGSAASSLEFAQSKIAATRFGAINPASNNSPG